MSSKSRKIAVLPYVHIYRCAVALAIDVHSNAIVYKVLQAAVLFYCLWRSRELQIEKVSCTALCEV